ncbi:MAG: 50S ribosomal protein L25 [SAR324 cluster bacterium]|nr:50S ribosomal protein L25 [SAR324 cluster bacterium]
MSLTVETREQTGKGANRQLRMTGLTPGVIYSQGGNINVKMRADYASRFLDSFHGSVKAVEIELLDGKKSSKKTVIIKDAQYSAWGNRLLHVDFMEVTPDTVVKVSIPIQPTDDCPAIKLGGVLQTIRRTIPVKGKIKDIPEVLVANVSELTHEDSLHVLDLEYPEGVVPIVGGRNFTVLVIAGKMKAAVTADDDDAVVAEGEEAAAADDEAKK